MIKIYFSFLYCVTTAKLQETIDQGLPLTLSKNWFLLGNMSTIKDKRLQNDKKSFEKTRFSELIRGENYRDTSITKQKVSIS